MVSSDGNKKSKDGKTSNYNQLNFEDLTKHSILICDSPYSPESSKSLETSEPLEALAALENKSIKKEEQNENDKKNIESKINILKENKSKNQQNRTNDKAARKVDRENKALQKLIDQYHLMSIYERKEWDSKTIHVAGLDEVGRGPLAGPVVAAACILDPENPILGLNDSKKLSQKRREELFIEIQNKAVCYSIVRIEQDIIDEVNILNATKMAMVECVRILCLKPERLLIDAIDLKGTGIPVTPIIKGDSLSISIAAASILAKVTRDQIMVEFDSVYPGYGFVQNKGYGTALHYEGIKKLGITPIHRKSFLKGWEGSF